MIFLHYLTFVFCIIMLAIFISIFVLFSETHADHTVQRDQNMYDQSDTYADRNNENIQIHRTVSGNSEWQECTCKDNSNFECKSSACVLCDTCCERSMPAICGEDNDHQYMIGKKNVTITLGSDFNDGGAICPDKSLAMVAGDPVDTCVAGKYMVDYKCDNEHHMHREVTIESKNCADWSCDTWCKCFDETVDYEAQGCPQDASEGCECQDEELNSVCGSTALVQLMNDNNVSNCLMNVNPSNREPCGKDCSDIKNIITEYNQSLAKINCPETADAWNEYKNIFSAAAGQINSGLTYNKRVNPLRVHTNCAAAKDGTFMTRTELNQTWTSIHDKLPCQGSTTTNTAIPTERGTYTLEYDCKDDTGNVAEMVVFQLEIDCDKDDCGVCGGTNECYPVITVEGATAVTLEADKTGTYVDPGASCAFDGVDIALTTYHKHHPNGEFSESSIDMSRTGNFIVQFRCEKDNITVTNQREVTIVDTRPPVITVTGAQHNNVSAGASTYVDQGATCQDQAEGQIDNIAVSGQVVNLTKVGTYVLNYDCQDSAGHSAVQKTRTVVVLDNTPPTIAIIDNPTTFYETTNTGEYTDAGAMCHDVVDGDIGARVEVSGDVVNLSVSGNYAINYDCQDLSGNPAVRKTRTVVVRADTPPVITLAGSLDLILEANKTGTYVDPGASCRLGQVDIALTKHHNHHANSNFTEFSESAIDMGRLGSFIVQYRCTGNGEVVTKERTVTIKDTMPPWINIVGSDEMIVQADKTGTYIDAGATCEDGFDGVISNKVKVSGQVVNLTVSGEYEIKYNCKDTSNHEADEKKRKVTVKDTLAPVITLHSGSFSCDDSFDYTPTTSTSCSQGDCGQCTYTCTDSSQNSASETAVVECSTPACCLAMTADCLSCNLDISVEEYCRLRPNTVGCPLLGCPQDCSRYFDGCNECRCSDGLARCTKKFCAEPTNFTCHNDQPDEPEHNCQTREPWKAEKREWCCVNERVGCCPQVRCRPPMDRCNRTWSQEVNDRGCLVYPCGVDRCAARPRGIILRDDRGIERMRTNANSTLKTFEDEGIDAARISEDGRVTIRVIDDRGRPLVEMACRAGNNACLNMSTPEDVVRRRNIIKEVVDTLGPVIMSVDESGLASLRISRAASVVIQPVKNKPVNTTNCADADVDVQTFEEDAYEIVLGEKTEQFMACTSHKLLALVTLKNINLAGRSEYSVECWHPKNYKWEFVELLREGDTFTCPVLPDYTFEIASVAGLTYALTVPPTPQAEPPAPAPPAPIVVYGSGVSKIEACIEDEITVVWNGTHDLRETETADCNSNETETSPWHSEFETTGYNKTFIGLGGRYQGETRYYMCSSHCGVNNARLEVTCKYTIDPQRRVTVNVAESNLEIPALIVAGAIIAIIAAALSAVFCKRAANKSKRVPVKNITVTSKDVDELEKRLSEKPLNWVP